MVCHAKDESEEKRVEENGARYQRREERTLLNGDMRKRRGGKTTPIKQERSNNGKEEKTRSNNPSNCLSTLHHHIRREGLDEPHRPSPERNVDEPQQTSQNFHSHTNPQHQKPKQSRNAQSGISLASSVPSSTHFLSPFHVRSVFTSQSVSLPLHNDRKQMKQKKPSKSRSKSRAFP